MAMDMVPVLGRIILGRGTTLDFFPWFVKAGRISRIAGKRIHYKTDDGTEKYLLAYSAVVDTKDEEEQLLSFTISGRKLVDSTYRALEISCDSLLTQMSEAAPTPPASTAKRVRKATA